MDNQKRMVFGVSSVPLHIPAYPACLDGLTFPDATAVFGWPDGFRPIRARVMYCVIRVTCYKSEYLVLFLGFKSPKSFDEHVVGTTYRFKECNSC